MAGPEARGTHPTRANIPVTGSASKSLPRFRFRMPGPWVFGSGLLAVVILVFTVVFFIGDTYDALAHPKEHAERLAQEAVQSKWEAQEFIREAPYRCLSQPSRFGIDVQYAVRNQLRDPDSFETIQLEKAKDPSSDGTLDFKLHFRSRNGMGGMAFSEVVGSVDAACELHHLKITSDE